METSRKRERGANYTTQEKTLLAELISQYKHIVENKETGSIVIRKKREAWKAITAKYNSNCATGPRQTEQLKALYDNMKQKARRDSGQINKVENKRTQQTQIYEAEVAEAIQNIKDDKVQLHKAGGGMWKPKSTDSEANKILAIIEDQDNLHSNSYDSGTGYFSDNTECPEAIEPGETRSSLEPVQIFIAEDASESSPERCVSPIKLEDDTRVKEVKKTGQINSQPKVMAERRRFKTKAMPTIQKKLKKTLPAEAFKRIYFKTKCQNAILERKMLMQEIMHNKLQHNLKMTILKQKLGILKN